MNQYHLLLHNELDCFVLGFWAIQLRLVSTGIEMLLKTEQHLKVANLIDESCEFSSNSTLASDVQPKKALLPIEVTEEGIEI